MTHVIKREFAGSLIHRSYSAVWRKARSVFSEVSFIGSTRYRLTIFLIHKIAFVYILLINPFTTIFWLIIILIFTLPLTVFIKTWLHFFDKVYIFLVYRKNTSYFLNSYRKIINWKIHVMTATTQMLGILPSNPKNCHSKYIWNTNFSSYKLQID